MRIILIGDEASKRTIYLQKAANNIGVSLQVISWETIKYVFGLEMNSNLNDKSIISRRSIVQTILPNSIDLRDIHIALKEKILQMQNKKNTVLEYELFDFEELKGAVIKIDPPSYETVQLGQMQGLLNSYKNNLQRMMQIPCQYLNTPEMIWKLLDKKETKLQLQNCGVAVTKMFDLDIQSFQQLLELMKEKRCYSVFVKPRYFSGAAGVTAFRVHPVNEKMRVYTSCRMDDNRLVNTKKMVVLEDRQEIIFFMEQLLKIGCIVERWYPKAEFEGKSYDLRVVYQFGHIAYIVVRQSEGPITNLHLNNHATDIKQLGLSQEKFREIENICKQAMDVFPGLNMAGIDIMLEKGTLRPLIIEMNGQGDLIYQDIYGENLIYSEQIEWLMSC